MNQEVDKFLRSEVNMLEAYHLTMEELKAGMDTIREAPRNEGIVKMIVRRPGVDERELVDEAELSLTEGLVGDSWRSRGSGHTPDRSADFEAQLTLTNARLVALLAQEESRWPLAGIRQS